MPRILRDSLRTFSSSRRPAVVLERAGPRHDVQRQRRRERRVRRRACRATSRARRRPASPSSRSPPTTCELVVQPVDAGLPGAGRGLVRRDDQLGEPPPAVQRAERVHHRQRRAVGVGDDALGPVARPASGLTSGTTSGTSGSIRNAPELSTTTAPVAAAIGAHCGGDLVGHVEHRDVDAVEDLGRQRLDLDLLAAHAQQLAGRAGGGDEPDLAPDVLAGGDRISSITVPTAPVAPTTARVGLRCRGSSSGPSVDDGLDLGRRRGRTPCARRGRRRRAGRRGMTTEIRISEVEIISMLTPGVGQRLEERRARRRGASACPRRSARPCRCGRRSSSDVEADLRPATALQRRPSPVCAVGLGQRERDVGAARSRPRRRSARSCRC